MVDNLKNGMVLGAITGLLLTYPKISSLVSGFIVDVLPLTWRTFAGEYSIAIYGLGVGAIVGYFIDKK